MIINFDNAATTFPKPLAVREAVQYAMNNYGGNAGRGGHALATKTSEAMFSARETAAEFFSAKPENTIFCFNCTHSLNMAILGILKSGDHVVISSMEHNSVLRPVTALVKKEIVTCSIAEVSADDDETVRNFISAIDSNKNTKAVIMTAASNVTGRILPFKEVAKICRKKGICFILDAAQAAGIIPLKLENGISVICTAGHKGLYGISGTGLLLTDAEFHIDPIMFGGTGSRSMEPVQPDFLPDRLESGTGNIAGAISVKAGINFIKNYGIENIRHHENKLCDIFLRETQDIDDIIVYRDKSESYVPIVSFNIIGKTSEETAEFLAQKGFCLRAGLHCAPLAHKTLGTKNGTVRFSPSVFSREADVEKLCKILKR